MKARHIQDSVWSNEAVPENPFGFSESDRVCYEHGVGYLYRKDGKFGFRADSDEPDEPFVVAEEVPDDQVLSLIELNDLRNDFILPFQSLGIRKVGGKIQIIRLSRWGQDGRVINRTPNGWAESGASFEETSR